MGRLRELLDELAASRRATQRAADERSEHRWDDEGGRPPRTESGTASPASDGRPDATDR